MKGIFIRIDGELDRRFTELCKREGFKKGALIAKMIREAIDRPRGPGDPIKEAEEFGIDTSLLYSNLKKTPTDRLRENANAVDFAEKLQAALAKKNDPV